ncbi:MAG: APC family permease [Tepidisphaeraceae bacterium]|jgi:amino acid transporter
MASLPSVSFDLAQLPDSGTSRKTNVLVVSSVALAFISFWRAAAIVLCDLASSAYYIGGISEQAIGKSAPWFILGVMLFSYAVRAVYVESCTMFTRGGVYKVVKEAMGGSLAKLSVSALMFDYILTGPISAVSAAQYILGLIGHGLALLTRNSAHPIQFDPDHHKDMINSLSVLIAVAITCYFWWINVKGIHESSDKALRIMQLTTVMAVLIIGWSVLTLFLHPEKLALPPWHPVFTSSSGAPGREPSAGWLEHLPRLLGTLGIIIAFGHSLLAMSGEESLAQVNREIEAPKLKNLLRAGFVIFLYSMLLTSLISFFAVMIIPDGKRVQTQIVLNGHTPDNDGTDFVKIDYLRKDPANGLDFGYRISDDSGEIPVVTTEKVYLDLGKNHVERTDGGYRDNLINGLVQYLAGPVWLKLVMETFVVLVGFLILAGAVNTAIVGSNGVLNRLAEDGVLTPNFLRPHARFGTSYRLINLVAILQLITIVASWGDVNTLGEAYAFGVIWSFVFKTLAMVVLRFKDKSPRHYEVPLNIRIHRRGVPMLPVVPVMAGGSPNRMITETPNMAVPADGEAPKPAINKGTIAAMAHAQNQIDLPIGITIIFLVLLSTALINLATKKTATIWGVGFTVVFLAGFIICEQISHRRRKGLHHEHLEQFNQKTSAKVTAEALGLQHTDPVLVAARGPASLPVLRQILHEVDTTQRDVVVVTCKVLPPRTQGVTEHESGIDDGDRELLTRIVTVAEEAGKTVHPVVLPTNNPLYAIAITARDVKATEVVMGVSQKMHADLQMEQFAIAWGSANSEQDRSPALTVRIVGPDTDIRCPLE